MFNTTQVIEDELNDLHAASTALDLNKKQLHNERNVDNAIELEKSINKLDEQNRKLQEVIDDL